MVINFDELPKDQKEVEQVVLFKLDGVEYKCPTSIRANVGLKYTHLARTQGPAIAADYLVEKLVGKDGFEALMDYEGLTEEMLTQVVEAASKIASGELNNPKASKK